MGWLNRAGSDGGVETDEPSDPPAVERPSLGVATLFDGVASEDERTLLDVGRASAAGFDVYRRFACRIRFAELLDADRVHGIATALDAIPASPDTPYDLILLWDLLDRVPPDARADVVERLVARSRPGTRLHLLVNASDDDRVPTWDFTVTALDRVRYVPAGPDRRRVARLLPAEVERLLRPFEVLRAFVSRSGMREYVAILR